LLRNESLERQFLLEQEKNNDYVKRLFEKDRALQDEITRNSIEKQESEEVY